MNNLTNLRTKGRTELVLRIYSDDYLYSRRHDTHFLNLIKERFEFSYIQYSLLLSTLEAELVEELSGTYN